MANAFGPGTSPGSFFQVGPYPGSLPFYDALSYYQGQMFGPQATAAGNLAASSTIDQAMPAWYSAAPAGDPGSGAAASSAQRSFGDLLAAQSAGRNAAAATNAQTTTNAAQGVQGVSQGFGQDIQNNLEQQTNLANEKAKNSASNMGLLSGLIGSFIDPSGSGSNLINAFTGGSMGQSSGLGQILGGGKGLLSSIMGMFSGGGDLSAVAPIAGDAAASGGADALSSLLDILPMAFAA